MSVHAVNKNILASPRKITPIVNLVRGRTVADALVILEHTPRRHSRAVRETIKSAKANAEHDHNLKPDSLFIESIIVSAGPKYRRYRPAARGRALPYMRRTSHIAVVVDGEIRTPKKNTSEKPQNEEAK